MSERDTQRREPWRIEVGLLPEHADPVGREIEAEVTAAGLPPARGVRTSRIYLLDGILTRDQAERVATGLLADPVSDRYSLDRPLYPDLPTLVTVTRRPRVMDPVSGSLLKAVADLGLEIRHARTARRFYFPASHPTDTLEDFAARVLCNPIIEEVYFGEAKIPLPEADREGAPQSRREVPILSLADEELDRVSDAGGLALSLLEMQTIRDHYKGLEREPTELELETIAQTWSEHCKHKTMRGRILYNGREIDDLLGGTIMKVTADLARPWCVSVFSDNAGAVSFDGKTAICAKVETHNHPSAIEPYGGAGTGIGGVIRDIMGCGLGAWPILNTDVFCFGEPDTAPEALPKEVIHPRQIMKGVVSGVRDYGNRMGIPTASGGIFFHPSYARNPLVFCGTIGVMPVEHVDKEVLPGDIIVVVGGRTGLDGIHGATFSSEELHSDVDRGAVQIGNPITEKKTLDTLIQARDLGLYRGVTDCGAGGLSSAVGEMGAEIGAEVDLDKVKLKYEGLTPAEIWISEAQERMVLAVPPDRLQEALDVFEAEEVEATPIGRFTDTSRLQIRYLGEDVGQIDLEFLHHGLPRPARTATWSLPSFQEPEMTDKDVFNEEVLSILSSWNVCSREWVIRQYDHEVQGGSVLKPLQGDDGPGDATVITPVLGSEDGIAVSHGMNPLYGEIDPYAMAACAIDEAIRNLVSVGADPERIALLDNFCWGNTNRPDRLGTLVRASEGCHDVAAAMGTPFISGKDSLNNEYRQGDESYPVTPTLLITALGHVPDIRRCVSMDLKSPGNLLVLVGETGKEMGGSHYYALLGAKGNRVPEVRPALAKQAYLGLHQAIRGGWVRSCHDLSEGGLAVAACEMAIAGGFGLEISLGDAPLREGIDRDFIILFSETASRFLIEVEEENLQALQSALTDVPHRVIGRVTEEAYIRISGRDGQRMVDLQLHEARRSWKEPIFRMFGEEES
ncbi:MAG: phosphoribosylformylglycinamidine synthase subunit PurL [Planctomycetota bacterium]|nr:phosphoribosylformylglycinamidine synthase subunit PurL [Planctomycetota bacterium]